MTCPMDPTPIGWLLGLLAPLPVVGAVGSKPGMVLGIVTGGFLSVIALWAAPTLGIDSRGALVFLVPSAFVFGFLLVGGAIAVRQTLL